jgi:hypothetical protein
VWGRVCGVSNQGARVADLARDVQVFTMTDPRVHSADPDGHDGPNPADWLPTVRAHAPPMYLQPPVSSRRWGLPLTLQRPFGTLPPTISWLFALPFRGCYAKPK